MTALEKAKQRHQEALDRYQQSTMQSEASMAYWQGVVEACRQAVSDLEELASSTR